MSHPWDWDYLIHRHLVGEELSEDQRTALNERLRKFPRLRKRLAEMAFEQANLRDALAVSEAMPIIIVPETAAAPLLKPSPELVGRVRRPWILPAAAAAACFAIIVGIVIWTAGPVGPVEVLAGEVRIEGARVEVAGAAPARVRLSDGSEAQLAPSSSAVFQGRVGDARQVVQLTQGAGTFKVAKAADAFRIDTSVGRVSVLGTEFTVELRKQKKGPPALAVSVASGQVRVESGAANKVLGPGQSGVFGLEPEETKVVRKDSPPEEKKPTPEKKEPRPVFNGIVHGKVAGKGDAHLLLVVDYVVSHRKDSSVEVGEGLPGKTLKVLAMRRKDLDMGFDKMHFLFVRKVEIGQNLTLDIRQVKGDEFTIGALNEEQHQWVAPRDERREDKEKKKPRDPETSPDRKDKREDQ